jgi:hypothetical protein
MSHYRKAPGKKKNLLKITKDIGYGYFATVISSKAIRDLVTMQDQGIL